jgi:beta-phosphoglucomutase-like phosphatase (HAD superfamily)
VTIRAVVFDCDGVFADSEPAHFAAFRFALETMGIELTEEDYFERYITYEDASFFRMAAADHDRELDEEGVDRLLEVKRSHLLAALPDVELFHATGDFLAHARGEGYRIAVASGARRLEVETILAASDVLESIDVLVTAEDVVRHKPDPEPFLTAMNRLNEHEPRLDLRPENCLVVEDAVIGVAAAREAGMWTVGLTTSYDAAALERAHLVLPSLAGYTMAGIADRIQSNGGV